MARQRHVVCFNTKCPWWAQGCGLTGSCSDHSRIMLGPAPPCKWRFTRFRKWCLIFWSAIFRGRRCWRLTPVAPRIVLDISCVISMIHFSWQVQYLVILEGDSWCSENCTARFMCDRYQSCQSFFMAGAIFGKVGGCLLLLRALYWTFHVSRGSIMRLIFRGRRNKMLVGLLSYFRGFGVGSQWHSWCWDTLDSMQQPGQDLRGILWCSGWGARRSCGRK